MEEEFLNACKNGNLEEAIKIYNENIIDIYAKNDFAFRIACSNGHIEVAKWLISLEDKPNIHAEDDEAFRFACSNGHIEVAKWLISLEDKPNIHAVNDAAFRYACYYGQIEVAKWLMTLEDKPNIHAFNDQAFRLACENEHLEVVKWLVNICDDYYIKIKDNFIISSKIKNSLEDLYDDKKYDKIIDKLKIEKKKIMKNYNDKCCMCFTENYNFLSSCNHCYCIECFLMLIIKFNEKECFYCEQDIIIEKCIVKI